MGRPQTQPDAPSHTPGTHKGEEWSLSNTEPGRDGENVTPRFATGINPGKRKPVDPRMPFLSPP